MWISCLFEDKFIPSFQCVFQSISINLLINLGNGPILTVWEYFHATWIINKCLLRIYSISLICSSNLPLLQCQNPLIKLVWLKRLAEFLSFPFHDITDKLRQCFIFLCSFITKWNIKPSGGMLHFSNSKRRVEIFSILHCLKYPTFNKL